MKKEGLDLVNLISPGTGHVIDPVTHKEQLKRIGEFAAKGIDRRPQRVKLVTWTLKYNRCHWLEILALGEHYARSELDGLIEDDGGVDFHEPLNVTRFAIHADRLAKPVRRVRFAGVQLPVPEVLRRGRIVLAFQENRWSIEVPVEDRDAPRGSAQVKAHGLQGPIDDAFTRPFLCVRGTGKAWNPKVQAWADASLRRFADEWRQFFRGECPVKDDKDVTEADLKGKSLILFGDPGSNSWIARVNPALPLRWSQKELQVGDQAFDASLYAPALIQPNPLSPKQYAVINSGHTFRPREINYLFFPRLGDWAVLYVGGQPSGDGVAEEVVRAGFCDEQWRIGE
jgi:hypothetical protein